MERNERLKRYLKTKYYTDDKKIITLRVDDESDLYNSLDSSNETILESVTDYLENTAEALLPLNEITISVKTKDNFDSMKFKRALNLHYGLKLMKMSRYRSIALRKKIILLFIAVISILLAIFTEGFINSIFYFLGTLSIWDLTDMIIFRDEEVIVKEFIYDILEDATVTEDKQNGKKKEKE